MDDALLLSRYARARDPEAFSELIRRHSGMVFGTCVRVLGDRQRAEDAAQECFLALAEQAGSIRHSLSAWLHRVALHIALREKRRARPDAGVDPSLLPAPQVEAWRTLAPQLDAALDALPEEARELVSRRYLGGATQAELAGELGVTQATISRRLQQAVAQLRTRLDAHLDDQTMQSALGCALIAPPPSLLTACGRIGLGGHHLATKATLSVGVKIACLLLVAALAVPFALRAAFSPAVVPAVPGPPHVAAPAAALVHGATPVLAAAEDAASPPPTAAAAHTLLSQLVTIDVSGWPLDRIIATLADQLALDGGMQAMADGPPRRIDTRLEIMPCDAGWPLADAVADREPLGAVLQRLTAACHCTLLVSDRIVLVSRPMTAPIAPLLATLARPGNDLIRAINTIVGSGDADALSSLLGALASPAVDALCARDPERARLVQTMVLQAIARCGGSWQSWLPRGDQMRILGSLQPARSGVLAVMARCRAHAFPISPYLLYLAGQVGGHQLEQDLAWVAADPAAALPGLPAASGMAPLVLATERAWAIKALGRAGARAQLPLIRSAYAKPASAPEQLAALMALGECGLPEDAARFAVTPLGGDWITGATAYVAATHLDPQRLPAMFALAGSIHWGAADAFTAYPCASALDGVLANSSAAQWWSRWAMWKGTARMEPAAIDAAIRARATHGALPPELRAILARDGDDQALAGLIAAMLAPPGVFADAEARRAQDVAQELAARLPPARQQRALGKLRAGLDYSRVTDAALSMLRARSSPALADELIAHWHEAAAQSGSAAPAMLRALAQLRQDRARSFIVSCLVGADGAALCRRAFAYEDLADPALRAQLLPLMEGKDQQLAQALATSGLAAYQDTVWTAISVLRDASDEDLTRLRANVPLTQGYLPPAVITMLPGIIAHAGDAHVRHHCVELTVEACVRSSAGVRTLALQTVDFARRDRDPGVAAFARKKFEELAHPQPWANAGDDEYAERLVMLGAMDDVGSFAATDLLIGRLQAAAPAARAATASPAAGGPPASSNF